MSTSSDSLSINDSWTVNLEIALLEDADIFHIKKICANRPIPSNLRRDVWRICLQLDDKYETIPEANESLCIEHQDILRRDCKCASDDILRKFSDSNSIESQIDNISLILDDENQDDQLNLNLSSLEKFVPNPQKIASDFENVITNFVKKYSFTYESENGWVNILKVLHIVLRPDNVSELYAWFVAFHHRFVASSLYTLEYLSIGFRILFQYHEPKLSNILDTMKLGPETYFVPWFTNIFSNVLSDEVLLSLWDIYLLKSDPLLGFYISLILLVNNKENILSNITSQPSHSGPSFDAVQSILVNLPKPLKVEDLSSLIELTEFFESNTPTSFRSQFVPILFGNLKIEQNVASLLHESLCMSVQIQEVLDAQAFYLKDYGITRFNELDSISAVRYSLVDCRPAEQYNVGHLPSAYFLDSSLILSEPIQFQEAVKFLLSTQQRSIAAGSSAAGKHITLLGSGRLEEDQLTNMVVAEFLRLSTQYVSIVEGGYNALHEALGSYGVERTLIGHDPLLCICCLPNSAALTDNDTNKILTKPQTNNSTFKIPLPSDSVKSLFAKVSTGIFRSSEAKTQPPPTKLASKSLEKNLHNKQETNNKCASYRNTASVFSIDDNLFPNSDENTDNPIEETDRKELATNSDNNATNMNNNDKARVDQLTWFKRFSKFSHSPDTFDGDYPPRKGGLDFCEPGDMIDSTQWFERKELRGVYRCEFLNMQFESEDTGFLVLAQGHLILLRSQVPKFSSQFINTVNSTLTSLFKKISDGPAKNSPSPKHFYVYRSVLFSLINKITSNRRYPECITFHYVTDSKADLPKLNIQLFGTKDRVLIQGAGDAVRSIKMAVFNSLSNEDQ